jgi:hypothetical protein
MASCAGPAGASLGGADASAVSTGSRRGRTDEEPQMDTSTAPCSARAAARLVRRCVAGDIGRERREIEVEPVTVPAPAEPAPAPAEPQPA